MNTTQILNKPNKLNKLNPIKMNGAQTFRGARVVEGPQCLEAGPTHCESKEQIEQRRRLDILKRWEFGIQVLDLGCVVKVGCKSIAFTNIEEAYKEIGRYLENPQLVATQHGFEENLF